MSVKLAVLKSGEQIIADVQEIVLEEKAVGYFLTKPCSIEILNEESEKVTLSGQKTSFNISLYPWIPLAKGEKISIPLDWVVTFVDPVDMLLKMYEDNVLNSNKQWGKGLNNE